MADNQPTIVLQPAHGPLHDPAMAVASQTAAVLPWRLFSIGAVRADQFDAAPLERGTQPIRVGGLVVQQSRRPSSGDLHIDQRFQAVDLGVTGGGGHHRDRRASSIDQEQDFRPLAAFGVADVGPPFFAVENVPSPIAWDQCISFRRSRRASRSSHASRSAPDSVHSWSRRQHVAEEGYRSCKTF